MNIFVLMLIVLVGVSRVAGRTAGGDSFTAAVIFFFAYLAILMSVILLGRSLPYIDGLVTARQVAAFALLAESLIGFVLAILRYRRTREGKYVGYALLFFLFFSFLVFALVGSLPVGAIG